MIRVKGEFLHKEVPTSLLRGCEDFLYLAYGSTLETLNDRGGLTPLEIFCLNHRIHYYRNMETPFKQEVAINWLKNNLKTAE